MEITILMAITFSSLFININCRNIAINAKEAKQRHRYLLLSIFFTFVSLWSATVLIIRSMYSLFNL